MDIPSVHTTDIGSKALALMAVYHVRHLPIVDDHKLIGLLSEEDVMMQSEIDPISKYQLSVAKPAVRDKEHIFDIMRKISEYELSVIPVIDNDENYIGLITLETVLDYYAKSFTFNEPGCIIVITINRQNYSLSEIAQIIEDENAAILSTFITRVDETNQVEIILKLNIQEPSRIQAALERYQYTIKGVFNEEILVEQLQDRYDMFMTYLNV